MRFEFIVDEHVKVKTFLKKHEVSKGLLAKIKFRGGQILVNGRPENAIYLLDIGDRLVIDIPAEEGFETLKPMDRFKQTLWHCFYSKCDSFQYLSQFCKRLLCEAGLRESAGPHCHSPGQGY